MNRAAKLSRDDAARAIARIAFVTALALEAAGVLSKEAFAHCIRKSAAPDDGPYCRELLSSLATCLEIAPSNPMMGGDPGPKAA